MHWQAQRLFVKYAKNLGKTQVFAIIYSCQSSKSVQRYSTCCIILWKNNVFSRRRLGTLAYIDLGVFWAPFWKVWASKLGPSWSKLGLQLRFLVSFGRSWAPRTDFELQQEYVRERWRPKMASWRPPSSILEVSSHDFAGFGRTQGLFLACLLT